MVRISKPLLAFLASVAFGDSAIGEGESSEPRVYEANYASLAEHPTPQWFRDAKLGIFVHWGIYSVPAWAPTGASAEDREGADWFRHNPYAEWYWNSLHLGDTPTARHHEKQYGADFDYYDFAKVFNGSLRSWQPDEMADLFATSGARYVVLTTKHHDGFTLWPSRLENPKLPPAKRAASRDLVGELAGSLRKRDLRFGAYYSGGIDWSFHPIVIDGSQAGTEVTPPDPAYPSYADGHLRELIERYQPDILWNDIRYPADSEIHKVLARFYNENPDGLVNDRWGSSVRVPPDFKTMEYQQFGEIQAEAWEANRGMGTSFGYNRAEDSDEQLLSGSQIVRLLVDVVSKNGNLLLNVGPRADGSIPEAQASRLRELGAWLDINGEAIYGTRPWSTAESPANDQRPNIHYTWKPEPQTLFAIVDSYPKTGSITLPLVSKNGEMLVRQLTMRGPVPVDQNLQEDGLALTLVKPSLEGYPIALRITPAPDLLDPAR